MFPDGVVLTLSGPDNVREGSDSVMHYVELKIDPFICEGDVFATLKTDDSMAGIVHVFC